MTSFFLLYSFCVLNIWIRINEDQCNSFKGNHLWKRERLESTGDRREERKIPQIGKNYKLFQIFSYIVSIFVCSCSLSNSHRVQRYWYTGSVCYHYSGVDNIFVPVLQNWRPRSYTRLNSGIKFVSYKKSGKSIAYCIKHDNIIFLWQIILIFI